METWSCTLEVATPLFLAGADQSDAELRAPTFKNLMRWWYRAAEESLTGEEKFLFGGIDQGAKFRLRLKPGKITPVRYVKESFSSFQGLQYLGFSLDASVKGQWRQRAYIEPSQDSESDSNFQIQFSFSPFLKDEHKKSILASFWLFLWLGGIGSRSRRGFGSLRAVKADPWKQGGLQFEFKGGIRDLPDFIKTNLSVAKEWIFQNAIGGTAPAKHTTLDKKSLIYVWKNTFDHWQKSLNKAGEMLMNFRRKRPPDYTQVKAYLQNPSCSPTCVERASFGLPIQFYYTSVQREKMTQFIKIELQKKKDPNPDDEAKRIAKFNREPEIINALLEKYPADKEIRDKVKGWMRQARQLSTAMVSGEKHERRASPLFIKVIKIKEKRYALMFIFLRSNILENGESIIVSPQKGGFARVPQPTFSAIDDFLKNEVAPNSWEIKL
ncbi:MAG: type III-B CRISPR module RAMP protein Cmr1 [Thermodesulfobacteriota bacterium]|nr:type III-B CRISPR module RAMP protein Cmr1 [Thermodesulfobacteriota bacterium]